MIKTTINPKACRQCKREFMPARPMQAVCGPICATRKVKADKAASQAAGAATDGRSGLTTQQGNVACVCLLVVLLRQKKRMQPMLQRSANIIQWGVCD